MTCHSASLPESPPSLPGDPTTSYYRIASTTSLSYHPPYSYIYYWQQYSLLLCRHYSSSYIHIDVHIPICYLQPTSTIVIRSMRIMAYILSSLLSSYNCSHVGNLILILTYNVSMFLYSVVILLQYSICFQCGFTVIALHHIYAHKPVLILLVCFTYTLSIFYSV